MIKKLKSKSGETLIEALIAMLIAVLSMMLLTTSVTAAAKVNKANRDADEKFSVQLQQAEVQDGDANPGNVTVYFNETAEEVTLDVNVYGKDGSLISYDYEPAEEEN